ncbi:3-oxoacyl-[acyl-carrier-protein] reductase FabG-like [Ixodes scapularis]|uniref:3-oxoacyl-[acyl-carrier-protein] reductase FabG-like n=1 Tax=Ixodes scapularis TaxID=6945 RepID=UPI001A9D3569|nr:3-oxoacyl-[acyl-carrier-protein] reductase FabG-like [Ixodes scapularis]
MVAAVEIETVDETEKGTFLVDRASVKSMLADNVMDGAIVNIASTIAETGLALATPYSASKGGVVSPTRAVALGVATRGIRVNAISPGPVDRLLLAKLPAHVVATIVEKTALKLKARDEQIAETIAFMCIPKASYMTGAAVVAGGIII